MRYVNDYCGAEDVKITPSRAGALSVSNAEAAAAFQARGYNCSAKSLAAVGKQSWEITALTLRRSYSPHTVGGEVAPNWIDQLEFWYNNTATDNDAPRNTGWRQCLYISDELDKELDGVTPLLCSLSFEPFTLGFKYNNATQELTLSQLWTCDGYDIDHT